MIYDLLNYPAVLHSLLLKRMLPFKVHLYSHSGTLSQRVSHCSNLPNVAIHSIKSILYSNHLMLIQ